MAASTLSRFALLSCAVFLTAVSCSDQVPLADDVKRPVTTADSNVVKQYKSSFHNWPHTTSKDALPTFKVLCFGSCTTHGGPCCPSGGPLAPPPWDSWSMLASSEQHTSTDGTATVTVTVTQSTPSLPNSTPWEPFPLPTTLLNRSPTRTTLFRRPDNSIEPNAAAKVETAAQENAEKVHSAESGKDRHGLRDITPTYYDYTLDGHHPFEVPLILLDSEQMPVTIFAFADLSQELSFISYGVLDQIGRTSEISNKKDGLSSDEMSRMLGFKTSSPGVISIDVLAGENDRRFKSLEFVVFDPTGEAEGELVMDLSVGMNFLKDANALQLTNEYVGVGAKEGLGIVLQRVYHGQGVNQSGHDEL